MANPMPVVRNIDRESINDLAEATQAFTAEQRLLGVKRAALHRHVARLRVANRIEEEQAEGSVKAAVDNLRRIREINQAEEDVWRDLLEVDAEDERCIVQAEKEISQLAHRAGSTIVHPDLLEPKSMVARRRQLRESGEISKAEGSAL